MAFEKKLTEAKLKTLSSINVKVLQVIHLKAQIMTAYAPGIIRDIMFRGLVTTHASLLKRKRYIRYVN